MKKILSKMFIVLQIVIILLPNISAYAIENTKEILEEDVEEIIIQHYDTQNQEWKDVKITKYYYKDCEDNKIPVYILNKGTDKEIKIDTSNIEQIEDIRIATILKNRYSMEDKTNLTIENDAYLATYEALYWITNNKELESINEELRAIKEEDKLNESEEDEIITKEEIKEKTEETQMEDTKQNIVKEEIIDEEVEDAEIEKKEESKTENQTQNEIISKVDSQEFTQDSVNENEAEKIEDNDKIALENSDNEVEKEDDNNLYDEVQKESDDAQVVIDNEENNTNNVSNENLEEGKIIEDKKTNIINIEKETEAEEKEENANAEETMDDLENKENEEHLEDKLQEEEIEINDKNNELNKRGQNVITQIYNLVEMAYKEYEKQEAEKEDTQESPNEEQEINESEKNENEEEIITPGKDSEEIQEEQEQESEETQEIIEEKEEQIQEMPTEDTEITEDIKETERENPKIDINCYTKNTISSNAEHEYEFKIENTGNTAVENFTFYNVISNNTEKILRISTGTYNLEVNYNVYYKTSKNIEYTLLEEGLNSKENYNIDFAKINLKEDEIITEIKIEFGNVDKNFTNTENLRIYTKINDNLKNETQIKNYAILEANYNSYKMCEDIETVSTIYNTEVKRKLPKTGY